MLKGLIGRVSLVLIAAAAVTAGLAFVRPAPQLSPTVHSLHLPTVTKLNLPWPTYGQAALGADGYGVLETHGAQKPAPTASVAKIVTALAVLKQKPLAIGEQGPVITLGPEDVNQYETYLGEDGSVVPVQVGEQITEYQALEAMLLPSANNMAYSLAAWAFGSLGNYTAYANSFVKSLGMTSTTITDASGFAPTTVSTANDLVTLGIAAMNNPVLAQIVAQKAATVPVAGTVHNINWLLGSDNIIGIKTGNTNQAGGVFLFAASQNVSGQKINLVGAVMGAPNLYQSMLSAQSLAKASSSGFQVVNVLGAGQTIADYSAPWGASARAVIQKNLSMIIWRDQPLALKTDIHKINASANGGAAVGNVSLVAGLKQQLVPAVLSGSINKPSLWWRLTH